MGLWYMAPFPDRVPFHSHVSQDVSLSLKAPERGFQVLPVHAKDRGDSGGFQGALVAEPGAEQGRGAGTPFLQLFPVYERAQFRALPFYKMDPSIQRGVLFQDIRQIFR